MTRASTEAGAVPSTSGDRRPGPPSGASGAEGADGGVAAHGDGVRGRVATASAADEAPEDGGEGRTVVSGLGRVLRRWLTPGGRPSRALRWLAVATALDIYAVIVVGGIVRVTGSGLGCDAPGDNGWPLCRGRLLPPLEEHALIEFGHRWLAAIASFLLVALVGVAWLRYRRLPTFVVGVTAVVVLLAAQIALGQLTVQYHLPGWIVMVHLANAELLLGALVFTVLTLFPEALPSGGGPSAAVAARRAALAAVAVYGLVLSGALVVATGSGYACAGWPLCAGGWQPPAGAMAALNVAHRGVAGLVAVLLLWAVVGARRAHPGQALVRRTTALLLVVLGAQVAAGAAVVELRLPPAWRSLHEALASGLWAVAAALALVCTLPVVTARRTASPWVAPRVGDPIGGGDDRPAAPSTVGGRALSGAPGADGGLGTGPGAEAGSGAAATVAGVVSRTEP